MICVLTFDVIAMMNDQHGGGLEAHWIISKKTLLSYNLQQTRDALKCDAIRALTEGPSLFLTSGPPLQLF